MKVVPGLAALLAGSRLGVLSKLWHRYAPSVPVRRRVFGFTIYYDLRDNPYYWASSRRHLETCEPIFEVLQRPKCRVWDVGCNVGIFSLRAAQLGHSVVAFDISDKALALLSRSAAKNCFKVETVPHAFSVDQFAYGVGSTCSANNQLLPAEGTERDRQSITFEEAAAKFGVPDLIKMDIEGGEESFFDSPRFKQWITGHSIGMVVEIHSPAFHAKVWSDVSHKLLDENHVLIQGDIR